jgi:hypothetical protein
MPLPMSTLQYCFGKGFGETKGGPCKASSVPADAHLNRVSESQAELCESLSHLSSHASATHVGMSGTCWDRSHLGTIATSEPVGSESVAAQRPRPINMFFSRIVGSDAE